MEECANKEEIFSLMHRFLRGANYTNTLHEFEKESAIYFNLLYVEELVLNGDCETLEKYLLAFTTIDDNSVSTQMFYQIRKLKFTESLITGDRDEAFSILSEQLWPLLNHFPNEGRKLVVALFSKDCRFDVKDLRSMIFGIIKNLADKNPVLRNKLMLYEVSRIKLMEIYYDTIKFLFEQRAVGAEPSGTPHNAEVVQETSTKAPVVKESSVPSVEVSAAHPVTTVHSTADCHVKHSGLPSSRIHSSGDVSDKGPVPKHRRFGFC